MKLTIRGARREVHPDLVAGTLTHEETTFGVSARQPVRAVWRRTSITATRSNNIDLSIRAIKTFGLDALPFCHLSRQAW
jgi:hypothetical protein